MRLLKAAPDHWNLVAKEKRRYMMLYHATPSWLSLEQVNQFGELKRRAARLRASGRDVHVDHIVPVVSDYVCGLNVPWNLQIIDAGPNMSKGNSVWPGCPWENVDMFDHAPQQLSLSL